MKCPTPITLKNPQAKGFEDRNTTIQVPCGKCGACRHNRRTEWAFRLKVEHRHAKSAFFITLTYTDATLPVTPYGEVTLSKKDVQDFIKRLRKENSKKWSEQLRYYAVGEYGTKTDRPHYHIILFNLHSDLVNSILPKWKSGQIHVGTVSDASIFYCSKYHITKRHDYLKDDDRQPEFALMSRRPAIGWQYLYDDYQLDGRKIIYKGDKNLSWHKDNQHTFVMNNGFRQMLPRYYKNKTWNEEDRKAISKINRINSSRLDREEIERLSRKGYTDPHREIFDRSKHAASKVKHKASDSDKF